MRPTVLLTRPAEDSARFAALLDGWPVLISPVLRIVPVAHDGAALAAAPGLVFTSAQAVPAAGPGRGRVAYCVGERTAAVARAAGFSVVQGAGDARRLRPLVAAATVPLVHPHGAHRAADLGVASVVVYDQQALPLTQAVLSLLAGTAPVVLPLFSPRSARLVGAQAQDAAAPLWLVPISAAAAAAWAGPAPARVEVADTPDTPGMLAALNRLDGREQS